MEIKTIKDRLNNECDFDKEVNKALSEVWILKRRYTMSGYDLGSNGYAYSMLIAELVRDEDPFKRICFNPYAKPVSDLFPEVFTEKIKIKYFEPDLEPLEKIAKGDWIDLRSAETVTFKRGEYYLIRLGVGMILPDGFEAHIVPRSSTPNKFGIVCANSMGIIDNSYSGDGDEWRFPAIAIRNTVIHKGDRICQFRIVRSQPPIKFEVVDHLNEESRGGLGSTGTR